MQPLISVIVPVYNGQDYLVNCIESIETQTYGNLEVLIVNDGSTDRTGEICRGLTRKFTNIRILETADGGVSIARNAGLAAAKGEYITFVDADDRLLPEMLEVLYDRLLETGSDISGCGFIAWKEEAEWKRIAEEDLSGKSGPERVEKVYSADEFLREGILKGNSRCWSKLYKRAVIGDQRFRGGLSIGEDMLFLIDLLPLVEKVSEVSFKGYGYYQNPKGTMNRGFLPEYMDQIACWEMARDKIMDVSGKTDAGLKAQVTTILLMAIMLTAGKLSRLPISERKRQKHFILICQEKLIKECRVPGAFAGLSVGYKVKVRLFCAWPAFYLWVYHFHAK